MQIGPNIPQDAIAVIRSYGCSAEIQDDPGESGYIIFAKNKNDIGYFLRVYDSPRNLLNLQFITVVTESIEGDLVKVNSWNDENRWVSASIDQEGDVAIQMNLAVMDGIPLDMFRFYLELWMRFIDRFSDYIMGG